MLRLWIIQNRRQIKRVYVSEGAQKTDCALLLVYGLCPALEERRFELWQFILIMYIKRMRSRTVS